MLQFEKRNIATTIVLSIVTCGIYAIIWYIKMGKEAVSVKDQNDAGTLEIVLMIFLPFVGFYLAEKKFAEGCQMRGIAHTDNSIIYLVLGLFGLHLVSAGLMQNDMNQLVDRGFACDPASTFQGAAPQYQNPQYQNPQYQNPQYQNPQYQNPQYQNPQYQNPQYQNPRYQNPPYQPPQDQHSQDAGQADPRS